MDPSWQRSVKRKIDQIDRGPNPLSSSDDGGGGGVPVAVRVEVENEVSALREAVASQQQTIQDLYSELDEERNAASSAANEAMSMILRLQREKAEVQMEFRQFKRFAEEKMAHDQQELIALDDLLFKRDQAVHALTCEIKAYKHRLLSCGIVDDPAPGTPQQFVASDEFDYPQLRCMIPCENYGDDDDPEASVLEKYTPTTKDQLQNLENRIYEIESEKKAAVNPDLGLIRDLEEEFKRGDEEEADEEEECEVLEGEGYNWDEESARVYTVDVVHGMSAAEVGGNGGEDTKESLVEDVDIKKLYIRLQALEADRESMRQAIISMRTEKAQLMLLKEIAQQLCKEVVPERKVVKKSLLVRCFSLVALIKWVLSLIFWRKKASRIKYSFGLSNYNNGLLLLLDKSPLVNQRTCLTNTRR